MKEKKNKIKKWFISLFIIVIVTGLGVGGTFVYKETEYKKAFVLLNETKPVDARVIFEKLGDYKESKTMVVETFYIEAKCILLDKNYDEAKELFLSISDYKDCAELAVQCDYEKAVKLFEDGSLDEAKNIFANIVDYKDSSDMIKECEYREALSLTDSKYFDAYMIIMEDTGMFNIYKSMSADDRFEWQGIKLPDNAVNGKWDRSRSYNLANYDMTDWSKDEEARERLIQLGDYSDSKKMVYEITKTIGSKMYSQGLFDLAKEEFDKYPEDGEFQFFSKVCLYRKAFELCKERQFDDAGVIFEKLIKDKEFLDLYYGEQCCKKDEKFGEVTDYYNRQDSQNNEARDIEISFRPENYHYNDGNISVATIHAYLYGETGEQLELYTFYCDGTFMSALDIVTYETIMFNENWRQGKQLWN